MSSQIYTNERGTPIFSYKKSKFTGMCNIYYNIVMLAPIFLCKETLEKRTKNRQVSERLLVKGTKVSTITYIKTSGEFIFNIDLLRIDEINWSCGIETVESIMQIYSPDKSLFSIHGEIEPFDKEETMTFTIISSTSDSQE